MIAVSLSFLILAPTKQSRPGFYRQYEVAAKEHAAETPAWQTNWSRSCSGSFAVWAIGTGAYDELRSRYGKVSWVDKFCEDAAHNHRNMEETSFS